MADCKKPRNWRVYGTFSDPPCSFQKSPDSGYASLEATPQTSRKFRASTILKPEDLDRELCRHFFDGNASIDDSDSCGFLDDEDSIFFIPQQRGAKKKQKPSTLPRLPSQTRPPLAQAFLTGSEGGRKLPRRGSDVGPLGGNGSSTRFPDRFVPLRHHDTDVAAKFRTSKAPGELSPTEKLLRHQEATPDAFCFRQRRIAPMVSNFRTFVRSDGGLVRNGVGTVLGPLQLQNAGTTDRQVSQFRGLSGRAAVDVPLFEPVLTRHRPATVLCGRLGGLPPAGRQLTMGAAVWSAPAQMLACSPRHSARRGRRATRSWRSTKGALLRLLRLTLLDEFSSSRDTCQSTILV